MTNEKPATSRSIGASPEAESMNSIVDELLSNAHGKDYGITFHVFDQPGMSYKAVCEAMGGKYMRIQSQAVLDECRRRGVRFLPRQAGKRIERKSARALKFQGHG